MDGFNEHVKNEAYNELRQIIEKHVVIIARTERSRLTRERMFVKNRPNEYNRLIQQAKTIEADTVDNLVKMTCHIVKTA